MPSCSFAGNDLADEEVDICGDDPPMSSYPTLEIQMDTKATNVNCSSSSNSSSDSGSSSGVYFFACIIVYAYIFYPFALVFILSSHASMSVWLLGEKRSGMGVFFFFGRGEGVVGGGFI